MFAKITNEQIDKYPYTIVMLRKDNQNTSFPKNLSDDLLSQWGVYPITKTDVPKVDHTKVVREGAPQKINGQWTQVWIVSDSSEEDIAARTEEQAKMVRAERASLLADTDWIVIMHTEKGTSIPMEWEVYRQALRDITAQPGFPYDIAWPDKPE